MGKRGLIFGKKKSQKIGVKKETKMYYNLSLKEKVIFSAVGKGTGPEPKGNARLGGGEDRQASGQHKKKRGGRLR